MAIKGVADTMKATPFAIVFHAKLSETLSATLEITGLKMYCRSVSLCSHLIGETICISLVLIY